VEILIERMGAGGDGIAPGPIYVPQALPGERLHVEINGKRGDGALATIHEILNPSLDRIAPACAHFPEGCAGAGRMGSGLAFTRRAVRPFWISLPARCCIRAWSRC